MWASADTARTTTVLERLASDWGLGAALEVAWRDGLEVGHIPHGLAGESPVRRTRATPGCRFEFVHVPVRLIRTDMAEVAARGIVDPDPDPLGLVFHEDGLITLDTLLDGMPADLEEGGFRAILQALVAAGVLVQADVDNRQIQFIDPVTRRRLEDSCEPLYVRLDTGKVRPAVERALREMPSPSSWSRADGGRRFHAVLDHVVERLARRSACTYCSARTIFPRQVLLSTARVRLRGGAHSGDLRTARDYEFGFTFAPFDDPTTVCHFLAWDHPLVGQRLASMAPHDRSFSDLVRLVRVINRDVERLAPAIGSPRVPFAGVCNHWAGNTILHQHYQFFRIPDLPLPLVCDRVLAGGRSPFARPRGVEVHRLGDNWPVPAYLIRTTREDLAEEFCDVVDEVVRMWGASTDDDGAWRTQNIWAWSRGSEVRAIFLPRDRRRVDAFGPEGLRKYNAGVLEMTGWFLVDDVVAYNYIGVLTDCQRRVLGNEWLEQLAPDEASVAAFEDVLQTLP